MNTTAHLRPADPENFRIAATTSINGLPYWVVAPVLPTLEKLIAGDLDGVIFGDEDGDWRGAIDQLRNGGSVDIREIKETGPDGKERVRHVLKSRFGRLVKTQA